MQVVTPPTEYPVTVSDAKLQCALIDDTHDILMLSLIGAATASVENYTGSKLMTQTVRATLDSFDDSAFDLGVYPVTAVDSFVYDDVDGAEQSLADGTDYWASLDGMYPCVAPVESWPATQDKPGAVRITLTVGYSDPALVPESIRQAILIRVKEMYSQRGESVTGTIVQGAELTVESLAQPHRRIVL